MGLNVSSLGGRGRSFSCGRSSTATPGKLVLTRGPETAAALLPDGAWGSGDRKAIAGEAAMLATAEASKALVALIFGLPRRV